VFRTERIELGGARCALLDRIVADEGEGADFDDLIAALIDED
jgi:hypothetical protein